MIPVMTGYQMLNRNQRGQRKVIDMRSPVGNKPAATSTTTPALWDIYDVDTVARTFKIRGHASYEVAVAGNWENIGTLSGFSASSNDFLASDPGSGDATHYVFIIVQRTDAGATITLKRSSTASDLDPDDDEEIYPLWQLAVTDTLLTVTMDLRGTKHWIAGA